MYYHVICVGCGGTGTFFLKEFGRFLGSYNDSKKKVAVTIIDGDRVENDNLDRQAFMQGDVSSFKSTAMVAALKESFNLDNVFGYPLFLDNVSQLEKINDSVSDFLEFKRNTAVTILIGAVDNHRARQVMNRFFQKQQTIFYFDAANEYSNGEVVFGGKYNKKVLAPPRAFYFPKILKDRSKRASERSCGSINKKEPQHIATNMLAGNILLSKVTALIARDEISLGIAFFDAFKVYAAFYPYEEAPAKECQ